jgi:lipopolysaccharide export LptBFGC system permease protein LptF
MRSFLADFDSSLVGIQIKLTNFVLPTLSVIGMGIAAVSFFTGSPNAKQHMVYAILGCVFGFGAQSIVNLIGGIVR